MKKRDAVNMSIEQMDAQQRKIEANRKKDEFDEKKSKARPSLLKRVASGLIDFAFTAIFAGGLFALTYFTIFPSVGYQSSAQFILDEYVDSGLFVYGSTGYEQLTSHYDANKTPEENYDVPVSKYYQTNERAISENRYGEYLDRKLTSGYYELNADNECVRKADVSTTTAREYLKNEYNAAVSFFHANPKLREASRVVGKTMAISLLIIATISSTIFYIVVPLIDKKNRTFSFMILKLIVVDTKTLRPISKSKNVLRCFVFIVLTFISPFTMNLLFGNFTFSFIPFFINVAILSFSKNNTGIHDLAAGANVINESYSNAFEMLNTIKSQGGPM